LHRAHIDILREDFLFGFTEITRKVCAQTRIELLGALNEITAIRTTQQMRIGMETLGAGELIIEIRRHFRFKILAAEVISGGVVAWEVHGVPSVSAVVSAVVIAVVTALRDRVPAFSRALD
jgi:hypothetical protein